MMKMTKHKRKNLWSIRIKHVKNCDGIEKKVFENLLKTADKSKYLGFIEERTYTIPKGRIIIQSFLIKGTPTKRFRDTIKKARLINLDFDKK